MREDIQLTFLFRFHRPRIFRQRMWCACLQFVKDCVTDALGIAAQMRIPEPQRLDTERLQKLFAFQIMFALVGKTVLAAVQLNIQFRLITKEIQIVNTDGGCFQIRSK